MRNKSNLILLVVLVALGIIYALTKIFELTGKESTIPADALRADTAKVQEITLYAGTEDKTQTSLIRSANGWNVKSGDITTQAKPEEARQIQKAIADLQVESLVSKSQEDWQEYNVGDSAALRVVARGADKTMLDMIIGRFQPKQNRQRNPYMQQQQQISGETYVRPNGKDEVFAVNGLLSMKLNRKMSDLRDNRLVDVGKNQIQSVTFKYPADSSFTLKQKQNSWLIGTMKTDSARANRYIKNLREVTNHRFNDKFEPSGAPDYEVIVEGKGMNPVAIKGYRKEGNIIVLNSSLNPETYFNTTMKDLAGSLLRPKTYFLKNKSK